MKVLASFEVNNSSFERKMIGKTKHKYIHREHIPKIYIKQNQRNYIQETNI